MREPSAEDRSPRAAAGAIERSVRLEGARSRTRSGGAHTSLYGRPTWQTWKGAPPRMEGRASMRCRATFITWHVARDHDPRRHAGQRPALCQGSQYDMTRLSCRPFQTTMRTGHPLEPRSSKFGRSTCQRMMGRPPHMEGHPSTLGRSLVETMKTIHSMSGRSGRSTSRIGPDRFDDRPGCSGCPNLIASLAAFIACRVGIEAS